MDQLASGITLTGSGKDTEVGKGELNNAATWDDYQPNDEDVEFDDMGEGAGIEGDLEVEEE